MKTILLIEDNEDIALSLEKRLTANQYQVTRLSSGWEVVNYLLKKLGQPDGLILDLMLPGRSGHELLNTIKSVLPKTKIFVFSAHQHYSAMIPKNLIEGFFLKTAGIENLIQAVDRSLKSEQTSS